MNRIGSLLSNVGRALQFLSQLAGHALTFPSALLLPEGVLAARLLAAESQLGERSRRIHSKQERPQPKPTGHVRLAQDNRARAPKRGWRNARGMSRRRLSGGHRWPGRGWQAMGG